MITTQEKEHFKPALYGDIYIEYNQEHKCQVIVKQLYKENALLKKTVINDTNVAEDIFKEDVIMYMIDKFIINHCKIPKYISFHEDDTYFYLTMEYIDGIEGMDKLIDLQDRNQYFSELEIKSIFKQLVLYIQSLHNFGIVHLDISAENILLKEDCVDLFKVTLIDLGASQLHHIKYNQLMLDDDYFKKNKNHTLVTPYKYENIKENTSLNTFKCIPITDHNQTPGKVAYMSPEVFYSREFDAFKSDIYALGVLLFLLTFQRPMHHINGPHFKHDIFTGRWLTWDYKFTNSYYKIQGQTRSNTLLDLIDQIIKPEKSRISLQNILAHPFLQ